MAIPDFQTLMRPIVELHASGEDFDRGPLRDALADLFELTQDEREELLPSGRQRRFDNRVAWALTHLYHAGLLERPRRGVTRITDRGRQVLDEHSDRIDMSVLNNFAEYREFRSGGTSDDEPDDRGAPIGDDATPEEVLEAAHQTLTDALAQELRDKLVDSDPAFFEQVVVDVLVAMGYGGSHRDAGQRLGRTGDAGIDGVIREDALGLDAIYLQAKRWDPSRTVGRPEIQGFVGALHGARASKGVFLTTARFSRDAIDYAESVTPRVVLIDGRELAHLMIEHGVGVTTRRRYELRRIDEDYFLEGDG